MKHFYNAFCNCNTQKANYSPTMEFPWKKLFIVTSRALHFILIEVNMGKKKGKLVSFVLISSCDDVSTFCGDVIHWTRENKYSMLAIILLPAIFLPNSTPFHFIANFTIDISHQHSKLGILFLAMKVTSFCTKHSLLPFSTVNIQIFISFPINNFAS